MDSVSNSLPPWPNLSRRNLLEQVNAELVRRGSMPVLPDVCDWAEEEFYLAETRRPIVLEPHQKRILRLMTAQRPDGRFQWTTAFYSTIKKSGKTTISALVGRWAAETWGPFQEIYNLGNKLKQAKERAFRKIRQSIELAPPHQRARWEIQETQLVHTPSGSIVQALPISDAGESGGNQSITIWTELWGFQYEEALRMWDEMQPVLTRPLSLRFVDTYAGYEGESELLKSLWNLALNDDGTLAEGAIRLDDELPVYGVPAAGLIAYIDQGVAARRMPWQQGEFGRQYYTQQRQSERRHNYYRLHENRWVSSVNALVPADVWDRLVFNRRAMSDDVAVWLATDASIRRDCAALAAVTVYRDIVLVLEMWVWEWDGEEKGIDYDSTLIPCIEAAIQRFKVMGVAYDEYQLHQPMTALSHQHPGLPFFAFPQGVERLRGDTNLLTRINEGKLRHNGDAVLKQHVLNAAAKEQAGGEAIRIVKRTARQTTGFGGELVTAKPIDAIIAVSMAAHYATVLWEDEQVVHDDSVRVNIGY